jgi:hypothetical protein
MKSSSLKYFQIDLILIGISRWISTNLFWAGTRSLEDKPMVQTPSLSPGGFKANKIKLL